MRAITEASWNPQYFPRFLVCGVMGNDEGFRSLSLSSNLVLFIILMTAIPSFNYCLVRFLHGSGRSMQKETPAFIFKLHI